VQPSNFAQNVLGFAPDATQESFMYIKSDSAFKKNLLYGIQWNLMIFYIISFVAIDYIIKSPSISGTIVYFFDIIVRMLFKVMGKHNLSQKALLDKRFLL